MTDQSHARSRLSAAGTANHWREALLELAHLRVSRALIRFISCALCVVVTLQLVGNYTPLWWLAGLIPVLAFDVMLFKRLIAHLEGGAERINDLGYAVWLALSKAYVGLLPVMYWFIPGGQGEVVAILFTLAIMANCLMTLHHHAAFMRAALAPCFVILAGLPLWSYVANGFAQVADLLTFMATLFFMIYCAGLGVTLHAMRSRMEDARAEAVYLRASRALAEAAEERAMRRLERAIAAPLATFETSMEQALRRADDETLKAQCEPIAYAVETLSAAAREAMSMTVATQEDGRALVDPRRHVRAVVSAARPLAQKKGLELFLDFAQSVPSLAYLDPVGLRLVLIDLIANALKFTEHGGVRVLVSAKPGPQRGKAVLSVAVVDTGVGMSKTDVEEVFGAECDPRAGGVARVRARLARMSGKLGVKSEPGSGAVVTFVIEVDVPTTGGADSFELTKKSAA